MLTLIFADLSVSARGHELNGDIQHDSPQERIPLLYSQLVAFFAFCISTYLSNRDHEIPLEYSTRFIISNLRDFLNTIFISQNDAGSLKL